MTALPLVLVCLFAVACKGTSSKPAPAPPRDGRALATTTSLPRADWPSGLVIFDRESLTAQRATFEYTSDEPCAMSVAVHARGIVGCPARIVHTNADGSQSPSEIVYDAKRRIVDDGLDKYVWDDAGVVDRVDVTYQQLAGSPNLAAVRKDGSHRSRWRVENGRALAEYGPSSKDAAAPPRTLRAELTWSAQRLERIDGRLHRTYLAYADAPVAAYPDGGASDVVGAPFATTNQARSNARSSSSSCTHANGVEGVGANASTFSTLATTTASGTVTMSVKFRR